MSQQQLIVWYPQQSCVPVVQLIVKVKFLTFRVVSALESFLNNVQVPEGGHIQTIAENIAVVLVCPNSSSTLQLSVMEKSGLSTVFENTSISVKQTSDFNSVEQGFLLPGEVFESTQPDGVVTLNQTFCKRRQAQFIVYANNNLFLDTRYINSPTSNGTITSGRVISAGVGEEESLNLTQPANMTFISEIEVCLQHVVLRVRFV